MPVTFHEQTAVTLKERKRLKLFLLEMFIKEGYQSDKLDIIFCSDDFLKSINIKFLKHDYYTDIITFDLSASGSNAVSGEIYISIDRVKENAATHKEPYNREIHRVILHGVLHLCGYKDKTTSEILRMRQKEDKYINLYFKRSTNPIQKRSTNPRFGGEQ